jgi:hypothetical protein
MPGKQFSDSTAAKECSSTTFETASNIFTPLFTPLFTQRFQCETLRWTSDSGGIILPVLTTRLSRNCRRGRHNMRGFDVVDLQSLLILAIFGARPIGSQLPVSFSFRNM